MRAVVKYINVPFAAVEFHRIESGARRARAKLGPYVRDLALEQFQEKRRRELDTLHRQAKAT